MEKRKGFTLIELMVVVLIVGILAAVAVPMMSGRIDSAKWSEANAAAGSIASAIRSYAAEKGTSGFVAAQVNGSLTAGNSYLGFANGDLNGTYFSDACYRITGAAYDSAGLDFTISVVAASAEGGRAYPTSPTRMRMVVTNSGPATWTSY